MQPKRTGGRVVLESTLYGRDSGADSLTGVLAANKDNSGRWCWYAMAVHLLRLSPGCIEMKYMCKIIRCLVQYLQILHNIQMRFQKVIKTQDDTAFYCVIPLQFLFGAKDVKKLCGYQTGHLRCVHDGI